MRRYVEVTVPLVCRGSVHQAPNYPLTYRLSPAHINISVTCVVTSLTVFAILFHVGIVITGTPFYESPFRILALIPLRRFRDSVISKKLPKSLSPQDRLISPSRMARHPTGAHFYLSLCRPEPLRCQPLHLNVSMATYLPKSVSIYLSRLLYRGFINS